MWLLQTETLTLEEFFDRVVPQYAILSHTWESEEVSFCELQDLNKAREKRGFVKIEYTCQQARLDGYKYAWIDTCCIDKSSSAELQEAINSMFVWYRSARVCYVYLCDLPGSFVKPVELVHSPDVSHDPSWAQEFAGAKWFTRGWTLQELIAPKEIKFYTSSWGFIGSKLDLLHDINKITGIDEEILSARNSDAHLFVSVAKRMSWAAHRQTFRVEDEAYSLLGIFGIHMPLLYGEGRNAFRRLQEQIIKTTNDHSIFAWSGSNAKGLLLAESPRYFAGCQDILSWGHADPFELTNHGLRIPLRTIRNKERDVLAILNCQRERDVYHMLALRIRPYDTRDAFHIPYSDHTGNNRFGLVPINEIKDVPLTTLEITMEHENRSWIRNATFLLRVASSSGAAHRPTLRETFPNGAWQRKSDFEAAMRTALGSCVRAGVTIQYGLAAYFFLVFGIDKVRDDSTPKVLRFIRMIHAELSETAGEEGRLPDFCNSFHPCMHSVHCFKGCAATKESVEIKGRRAFRTFNANISNEQIMGANVYTVNVQIK